jgi:hypothetical protein
MGVLPPSQPPSPPLPPLPPSSWPAIRFTTRAVNIGTTESVRPGRMYCARDVYMGVVRGGEGDRIKNPKTTTNKPNLKTYRLPAAHTVLVLTVVLAQPPSDHDPPRGVHRLCNLVDIADRRVKQCHVVELGHRRVLRLAGWRKKTKQTKKKNQKKRLGQPFFFFFFFFFFF